MVSALALQLLVPSYSTVQMRLGGDAFKGEARIRVMRNSGSGGRRGRSRDDRQSHSPIVLRAAPCDPDRAYGRASRLPCRLFAAQGQHAAFISQSWMRDGGARRAVAGLGNND